jgi:hypothetical protein
MATSPSRPPPSRDTATVSPAAVAVLPLMNTARGATAAAARSICDCTTTEGATDKAPF